MAEATDKKKYITYCGSDRGFFVQLQSQFEKSYPQFEFVCETVFNANAKKYHTVYVDILNRGAHIIYVDLSTNENSQKLIIQMLKRMNRLSGACVVALVDNVTKIPLAWSSNADFYFVKSHETFGVVHHPINLLFPEAVSKHDFAVAKLNRPYVVQDDMRLGYFGPDYIHCEGNCNLEIGDSVVFKTQIDKFLVPSRKFKLRAKSDKNLYYDFKNSYDFEMVFLDPPEIPEEVLEEIKNIKDPMERDQKRASYEKDIELKSVGYADELKLVKRKYKKWLQDSIYSSSPKKTKIMIVDYTMGFMNKEEEPVDRFPYTIRCLDKVTSEAKEIDQLLPHIIVYNFPDPDAVTTMGTESQIEQLETIIKKVKSTPDYQPFVIVFNCKTYSSKAIQDSFRYPLLMANSTTLDLNLVVKMAELYETKHDEREKRLIKDKLLELRKKDPAKYGKWTESDLQEPRFFVKKTNPQSVISLEHKVQLRSLSETTISFSTDKELELQNYRFVGPGNFYFRLIPIDGKKFQRESGKNLYKGLIHGVDVEDIEEIRRFVNAIFQLKETELAQKELDEFMKLNAEKLQEKIDSEEDETDSDSPEEES